MNRDDLLAVVEDRARNPWALAGAIPHDGREVGRETRTNPTCGDRVELALHLVDEGSASAGNPGDEDGDGGGVDDSGRSGDVGRDGGVDSREAVDHEGGRVYLRGATAGCALSTAAGDILAEVIDGWSRHHAAALLAELAAARLRGRAVSEEASALLNARAAGGSATSAEDLRGLAEMEVVPLRRRCIAFPWKLAADLLAGDQPGG